MPGVTDFIHIACPQTLQTTTVSEVRVLIAQVSEFDLTEHLNDYHELRAF